MENKQNTILYEIEAKILSGDVKSTSQLKLMLQQLQKLIQQEAAEDYKIIIELQKIRDTIKLPVQNISISQLVTDQQLSSEQSQSNNCINYKDLVTLLNQQASKAIEYAKKIKEQRHDIIRSILSDLQLAIKTEPSTEQKDAIHQAQHLIEQFMSKFKQKHSTTYQGQVMKPEYLIKVFKIDRALVFPSESKKKKRTRPNSVAFRQLCNSPEHSKSVRTSLNLSLSKVDEQKGNKRSHSQLLYSSVSSSRHTGQKNKDLLLKSPFGSKSIVDESNTDDGRLKMRIKTKDEDKNVVLSKSLIEDYD